MFLKYSCQEILEKNVEDQYFQKSWQAARNFQRFTCILTKFLFLKTSFADIQKYAFFILKNCPPEAVDED